MKINNFLIFLLLISTSITSKLFASGTTNSRLLALTPKCSISGGGDYCYTSTGRTLNEDKDIPGFVAAMDKNPLKTIQTILNNIPGLNIIIAPIEYMVAIGILSLSGGDSEEGTVTEGSSDFLEGVFMAGGIVVNILSPTDSEGLSAAALEAIFQANLHCKYQKVYLEETEFLTKMETSPDGGYAIFPIYPIVIPVNESTGQCDVSSIIDSNMKKIIAGNAVDTKCSFSYSATSDTCLEKIGIPIFTAYTVQVPIAASLCVTNGDVAGTISAVGSTASAAVSLFLDNKLALDPIVMKAVINTKSFFEIMATLVMSIITNNWVCLGAKVSMAVAVDTAFTITINAVAALQYDKAVKAIQNVTFCGYDWLSYKKTDDGQYWVRGNYEHSHYQYVIKKIENQSNSSDSETIKNVKNQIFREYTYGGREYDSGLPELEVSSSSDNRANYLLYDVVYCVDPRTEEQKGFDTLGQRYYMRGNEKANFACNRFFYDGESGCYLHSSDISDDDKKSGKLQERSFSAMPLAGFRSSPFFSTLTSIIMASRLGRIVDDNKYYLVPNEKYSIKCQEAFAEARKCCKHRSKNMVCLEDKSKSRTSSLRYNFCFSNIVEGYSAPSSNLFTFLRDRDKDTDKSTCYIGDTNFETGKKKNTNFVCVFSHDMCPYDFKLNAGLNYRASYCDSDYFTDYRDPVSILTRESTHLNALKCKEGLFSESFRKKYKDNFGGSGGTKFAAFIYEKVQSDMKNANDGDFEKIYNFDGFSRNGTVISNPFTQKYFSNYSEDKINRIRRYGFQLTETENSSLDGGKLELLSLSSSDANKLKSSAFGKVKNFCQYKAHCIEVEREENYGDSSTMASLFLDSSCNGTTSNSRNILPDNAGGLPRQFSAPVVECIFESLKNLIQGMAGNSLCESEGSLNSNGFCGTDSESTVLEHLNDGDVAFFAGKYKMIDGKFIIKNQVLPDSYNPFRKIQKYFIRIVRAALALFMAIYFYKQLVLGNMENFIKAQNLFGLTFALFKFSVVIWLIFYNGWQRGAYSYLVNFSTAGYSFINNIFSKVVKNPKNQIINFAGGEKSLRIIQKDAITEEEEKVLLCFKYDIFDKITFAMRDADRRCPRGFYSNYIINSNYDEAVQIIVKQRDTKRQFEPNIVISNNAEISKLLYFVDDYNKDHQNKLRIEIKTGGDSWGSHLDDGGLWEPNYDGCYFDTSEYKADKSYLSMFDTLDCKLIRYLGYSTNNMAPNIILYSIIMLVPSLIFPEGIVSSVISGIGSFLFGLMMTFIFIIINVIIKTVYLFTSAFFTLSILIFLSPIILPLMFFERTKNIFDSWVENIMDSIFKPILNFAFMIVYVNVMDIILLENATFEKHSNIGRGANLICPPDASSFICLINGFPVIDQIRRLFTAGLFNVLVDALVVFLFFKLSDSILDDLDKISSSIFKSLSGSKSSSSLLNPSTFGAKGVGDAVSMAMDTGKKLENFRSTYMNNAPGALLESVRRTSGELRDIATENKNTRAAGVFGAPAALIDAVGDKTSAISNKFASMKDSLKNRASDFVDKRTKMLKNKFGELKRKLLGGSEKGSESSGQSKSSSSNIIDKSVNNRVSPDNKGSSSSPKSESGSSAKSIAGKSGAAGDNSKLSASDGEKQQSLISGKEGTAAGDETSADKKSAESSETQRRSTIDSVVDKTDSRVKNKDSKEEDTSDEEIPSEDEVDDASDAGAHPGDETDKNGEKDKQTKGKKKKEKSAADKRREKYLVSEKGGNSGEDSGAGEEDVIGGEETGGEETGGEETG
ncbi:MAG: type IV secretion system protein, partial [Rickettsiales bacterium]|nr:type IV secretion system protein [Rickettsiales bacterium]